MTQKLDDDQLRDAILALVEGASGDRSAGSPLNRLQVRIADDSGGELHDPEEVLRQVSEIVLGGLEITDAAGDRRRISFDGVRALDYSQSRVIPRAREAFVGMLMGTYKPIARFVRGASQVAAKSHTRFR